MEIRDPSKTPASGLGATQGTAPTADGRPRGPDRQAPATDQIQLSKLSAYLAAAQSGSPEHAAKLSVLAGAVSGGGYQVDASRVSASMIQHSIEFGGASYAP